MEQNSPEWYAARAGKITASRMCDVLAYTIGEGAFKSGPRKGQPRPSLDLQARRDYIGDILAEILTGEPKAQTRAKTMDWGHDVESAARSAYEAETGQIVELAGFVLHPGIEYLGCSPDGLIGADGQLQIKCPANPAIHVATLSGGMPAEHMPQVQAEMLVTGRDWNDFVSFDPRMPLNCRLYVERVHRDDTYINDRLIPSCASLWESVQTLLEQLRQRAA